MVQNESTLNDEDVKVSMCSPVVTEREVSGSVASKRTLAGVRAGGCFSEQ